MPTVLRSDRAEVDLLSIWVHVAESSMVAADRLFARFEEKLRLLADFPELGELRPDLAPGLRGFVVGSYVIFYRPGADGIQVERVLSGARDTELLF